MQSTQPNEMGQASIALSLGLLDVLASKGMLIRDDLDAIVTVAIAELETMPANDALSYVKSLLPRIRTYAEPGRQSTSRRRSKQFLERIARQRRGEPDKRPSDEETG